MKNFSLNNFSIKYKYIVAVLPLIFITYMVIIGIFVWFFTSQKNKEIMSESNYYLSNIGDSIKDYIDQVSLDVDSLFYTVEYQKVLVQLNSITSASSTDRTDLSRLETVLSDRMNNYSSFSDTYIRNVCFKTMHDIYIAKNRNLMANEHEQTSIMSNALEKSNQYHGLPCLTTNTKFPDLLLYSQNIYQWQKKNWNNPIQLGTAFVEIRSDYIISLMNQSNLQYLSFIITDDSGNIVINNSSFNSATLSKLISNEQFTYDHEKYNSVLYNSSIDNLKLYAIINYTKAMQSTWNTMLVIILFAFISFMVIILATCLVSSEINKEFQFFINKQADAVDFEHPISVSPDRILY
jgi:hypothetical protein